MEQKFGDKLNQLDLTEDEIKRLSECMKDDKFVDLLRDYAMEISNPENKKKYEEEIAMMEMERGNDVKFIHPCPGHVLKTSRNGEEKCFINICSSPQVGKPVNKPTVKGSTRGMQWSIPHSLSQPRDDTDKAGGRCMVYDVVFHPDTYHMSEKNARFRKMIHDMALDAVERLFKVTLDKVNVKKPKMKFKGLPQASIVRIPREDTRELNAKSESDPNDPLKFPYPPMNNGFPGADPKINSTEKPKTSKINQVEKNVKSTKDASTETTELSDNFVEPKYTLTHRGYFDMKDYYSMPEQKVMSTRPKELILNVELPMLKVATALHLEIFEDRVYLECAKPVKYRLDLKLPYSVDDSKGHARFDKSKKRLTITLEVLPPVLPPTLLAMKNAVQEVKNKACGSCNHDDKQEQEEEEVVATEEDPSEDNPVPSDHPSGLVHGNRTRCCHENHGSLWGKEYDDNSDSDQNLGYLYITSSRLVEFLAEHAAGRLKNQSLTKARPQLLFHQDEKYVSLIINISFIDPDHLWYILSCKSLQFSSMVKDRSTSKHVYQLYVKFDKGNKIDPRRSRVDISGDNAVFVLRKHSSCENEWQMFQAGFDEQHLKDLSFGTEKNINDLIASVKLEAQKSTTREFDCEDVSDVQTSDLLALKLTPKEIEDECRLVENSDEDNEDVIGQLPTMDKSVELVRNIIERDNNVHIIDHDRILAKAVFADPPAASDTDEDDDSATYETAESSDDDRQENMVEEINKNEAMKTTENIAQPDTVAENATGDSGVNSSGKFNPLIVKEFKENGEETTQVLTDHKTKSIVKLNNEMLFEIDSD